MSGCRDQLELGAAVRMLGGQKEMWPKPSLRVGATTGVDVTETRSKRALEGSKEAVQTAIL